LPGLTRHILNVVHFPKIPLIAARHFIVSVGSLWSDAFRISSNHATSLRVTIVLKNLLDRSPGRITTQLLDRQLEQQCRVALQCLRQTRHTVQRKLVGTVLEHREHIRLHESGFDRDFQLRLARLWFKDPLLQERCQAGVGIGPIRLSRIQEDQRMAGKRNKPEEIVSKLRQVEVLPGQGMPIADAVRQIGTTQQT
jgi:hypothetical protein